MYDQMKWASPVPMFGAEDPDRLERMRSYMEHYAEEHQLTQTAESLKFAWKCHEGQFRKSRNRLLNLYKLLRFLTILTNSYLRMRLQLYSHQSDKTIGQTRLYISNTTQRPLLSER